MNDYTVYDPIRAMTLEEYEQCHWQAVEDAFLEAAAQSDVEKTAS